MSGLENKIVYGEGFKLQTSSARSISDMQRTASDVSRINYVGDPEGVVSANPSSFSHDPTTGNVYIKTSGTGNTGWTLIPMSGSSLTKFSVAMRNDLSVAQNSLENIAYDEVLVDTASAWTAPYYTVPTTGNWLLSVNSQFNSTAGYINCDVFMAVDPVNFLTHGGAATILSDPLRCSYTGSILVPLNAGDLIKVASFSQTTGSTAYTCLGYANGFYNTFSGVLL